ncbi:GABA permease [Purpureocillium lavendulum]|nr:GABA permease [Purpureocillium lavendulum]
MALSRLFGGDDKDAGANTHVDEFVSKHDHQDRDQLARLGKKQVLRRTFGFFSIVGLSCTVLITWEGSLILFQQGLMNGGPAGIIYSFLFVWLGNLSVFSTLSELASMAPTSGGQYHWVSMLAPRSCSKVLSYVTGWLAVGGWQGTVATGSYLCGSMIQGLIIMTVSSYDPQPYQGTLLSWAVAGFCVFINVLASIWLPRFESLILVLHIGGFFAILIPVVVLGPHSDATTVFTTFQNGGGWPTQGLSFFVGMIGQVFAFVGVDAAFHMSEEVHNAAVVVPQSIIMSMLINGTLGFAMNIAVMFCLGNLDDALNSRLPFAFMEIFLQATHSVAGAATMSSLVLVLAISATVGIYASTSRVFWSFARDRGLPFWQGLSKIDSRTAVPRRAVLVTAIISCLLGLINIGSSTAFNDVVSLSISGLYASYLIATGLLLYRRCTSGFALPDASASLPALANTAGAELVWGSWHIPGTWGIINNGVACVYLVIVLFFSLWPPVTPVNAETMNYSAVVTGAVAIFSAVYYLPRTMSRHHPDLVMCRKQPGIAIGRLCDKCDGKCPVCDSYVRPTTLVRICDECSFGNYQNKCVVCGGEGISDAFYCFECTRLEKDRDGCPKIINLGSSRTDLFYQKKTNRTTNY